MEHYTYRAEWSAEDGEYVGLCAEFPTLSWLADTAPDAIFGIAALVVDVVADLRACGEDVPQPLGGRRYNGKVLIRTSADLHRRLTIEAAEQGVSVNQWVVQQLSSRQPA